MIKDGKKPISEKASVTGDSFNPFMNTLTIDPKLVAMLKAKGLEVRFISATKLKENGGYHQRGWEVYKPATHGEVADIQSFKFGQDPDGIMRRGDIVLAVRSVELGDQHRKWLKNKADRLKDGYNKTKAEELRQLSRDNGIKATIHEGYEDNE